MKVFVPKERAEGENRVAATPETVKKLVDAELEVVIEKGAGAAAHFHDDSYDKAGASVVGDDAATKAWGDAKIVLKVAPPTPQEAEAMSEGAVLIGFQAPHKNHDSIKMLQKRKVETIAMELIPRITRAQSMDALSSQASIAGYKAVLIAAQKLDKYFPLLMTAAGTIQPAHVVIMGAGVAGLQAIATAKRLGAVVEVSDIREEVKEQVQSLGGKFIDLPMDESGSGEGGYAKEVTPEFLRKQQEIVAQKVEKADVVITTALVPGKPAPKLVTEDMVKSMREGAVIVDLAVEQGGNCELSKKDEEVVEHGVRIVGTSDLPSQTPLDASMLYARNVLKLVQEIVKEGELALDLDNEIVDGALLTHEGEVRHEPTKKEQAARGAATTDEALEEADSGGES